MQDGDEVQWPAVKRRLFTILSALSLLLFLTMALTILPACCLFNPDPAILVWSFDHDGQRKTRWSVDNEDETMMPVISSNIDERAVTSRHDYLLYRTVYASSIWDGNASNFRLLRVRLWPPFVVSAILPCIYAIKLILRRRLEHARQFWGLCPSCGYDLRATPGRCPECGEVSVRTSVSGKASA